MRSATRRNTHVKPGEMSSYTPRRDDTATLIEKLLACEKRQAP
jgi:hypothetical protein